MPSSDQKQERFTVRCPVSDGVRYRQFAREQEISVNTLFCEAVDYYIESMKSQFQPSLEQESINQLHIDHEHLAQALRQNMELLTSFVDMFHLMMSGDDIPELDDLERPR